MFELTIGRNVKLYYTEFNECLLHAVTAFHQGAECNIVSMLTGEVLVSLRDEPTDNWVSSCIKVIQ